jgi:hypothetical protein
MVCVPCIVIPLLLYIWHRFLQPIFLKFWNPWGKVEDKTSEGAGDGLAVLKCPLAAGGTAKSDPTSEGAASKKVD